MTKPVEPDARRRAQQSKDHHDCRSATIRPSLDKIALALSSPRDNYHLAATAKMAILIVAAFPSRLSRYRWRVQLKNDKSVADLSAMLGPILRGWQQYYGHFHGSALKLVWRRVNRSLIGWLMRKHKKVAGHKTRAAETLKRLAQRQPRAFVHWSMGYLS